MLNFPNNIEEMHVWCQKVLPLVYADELSYYETLCKTLEKLNDMIENMKSYEGYLNDFDEKYTEMLKLYNEVKKEIEKIKKGGYVNVYVKALGEWIDRNLQQIIAKTVTYVTFGLTNDGRFCAMIPETWNFITFDTCIQPSSPLYGHLLLRW